jgi:hypothetical protein
MPKELTTIFANAIAVVNVSEGDTRGRIVEAMPIGGVYDKGPRRLSDVTKLADQISAAIAPARMQAIKSAFRYIRENIPEKKINGGTLAAICAAFIKSDETRIASALFIGLSRGDDADELVKRIVGSTDLRGSDGATQATRALFQTLGRAIARDREQAAEKMENSNG